MSLEACNHQNFIVAFNSEVNPVCPVCDMEGESQSPQEISMETESRTINLDNSMSATEIQTLINGIGKYIPHPVTITLQFADGVYSLDQKLWFIGFYGGGGIRIWGNRNEASHDVLHSTQQVYLDHGNHNGACIHLEAAETWFDIYNIKARTKTDSSDADRVIQIDAVLNAELRYNYFLGTGTSQGHCIHVFKNAAIGACWNYVSNAKYGISCINSRFFSDTNDDTGTSPRYGLAARNAGIIGKLGSQPAGSSINEVISGGGIIR